MMPDTQEHKLKPVLGQPWAAGLTEGSSRIGPEQTSERGAHVTDGVPNPLPDRKLEPAEGQAQLSYFDQNAEPDLVLLGQPAVQQGLDQLRLEAALLHPNLRSQEEETLGEVALLTSQTAVRQRDSEAERNLAREQRAEQWIVNLGRKTIAARLAQLTPHARRQKEANKKKQLKWKKGSLVKKLSNQLRKKAKKAAEAAEVGAGPLEGKRVTLVGWRETAFFANMEGSVVQHREAERTESPGGHQHFQEGERAGGLLTC